MNLQRVPPTGGVPHRPDHLPQSSPDGDTDVAVALAQHVSSVQVAHGPVAHGEAHSGHVLHVDTGVGERSHVPTDLGELQSGEKANEIDAVYSEPVQNATTGDFPVEEPMIGAALLHRAGHHSSLDGHHATQSPCVDDLPKLLRVGEESVEEAGAPGNSVAPGQIVEKADFGRGPGRRLFNNNRDPRRQESSGQLRG